MTSPASSSATWRRRVRADWTAAGAGWARWEPELLSSLTAVDVPLLRALELKPGHRVLDAGCGLGDPALAAAQWVAPRGSVVGLDVSATMLQAARRRAKSRGIRNVRFVLGDMARSRLHGRRFDAVVSRYGVMFVDDVPAALANLHDLLVPGGRIALAVWAERERNAMFMLSMRALEPFLTEPMPDPEQSPHPMRFSRAGRLARFLRAAGFTRVRSAEVKAPIAFKSPEDFATEVLEVSSSVRRLYATLPRGQQREVSRRLVLAATAYRDGGLVRLPGLARVVSAVRPARAARRARVSG